MNGYPYMLGTEVEVVGEVSLTAVLGFEPASRARALQQELLPRCTPGVVLAADQSRLAGLVAKFLTACATNDLRPALEELRALAVRCTSEQPSGPWRNRGCDDLLKHEVRMVSQDADNVAACDGSGAVRTYIAEAETIAMRFDAWARRHYEEWPCSLHDEPMIASVGPELIINAYLLWKLVEPLLEAPPKPLSNLFEPLAEIVMGGALLVGWNESECVLYLCPMQ